jgi:hypothetical protein
MSVGQGFDYLKHNEKDIKSFSFSLFLIYTRIYFPDEVTKWHWFCVCVREVGEAGPGC